MVNLIELNIMRLLQFSRSCEERSNHFAVASNSSQLAMTPKKEGLSLRGVLATKQSLHNGISLRGCLKSITE